MKKLLYIALIMALLVPFAACNKNDTSSTESKKENTSSVASKVESTDKDDKSTDENDTESDKMDLLEEIANDKSDLDFSKYSNESTIVFYNEKLDSYYFLDIPIDENGAVACTEVMDFKSAKSVKNLIDNKVYSKSDGYKSIKQDSHFLVLEYDDDNTKLFFGRNTKDEIIKMLKEREYKLVENK